MANKIALLLLAGIVISATGAGAALGLYVSGSGPFADAGGDETGDAATPTVTAAGGESSSDEEGTGNSEGTATPTVTPTGAEGPIWTETGTPTVTPTPETIPADSFNETRIASFVVAEIDERRAEQGRNGLRSLPELGRMATNHSRRMSEQGYVSHDAGGYTTEERYRRNDLHSRCQMPDDTNTGIREGSKIETVAKVSAGSELGGRLNRDDREVAVDAVGTWFNRSAEREKLINRNADTVGVGVVVTADNRAYITVDLCT